MIGLIGRHIALHAVYDGIAPCVAYCGKVTLSMVQGEEIFHTIKRAYFCCSLLGSF